MNDWAGISDVFQSSFQLGFGSSVIILVVSFLSGLVISWVYWLNSPRFSVESQFRFTLTMICMIVAAIMAVIGTNVTLSLGLIGALSIIRFRAVIKNSVDMTYLFWSIATGLAMGARAWDMAFAGLILIGGGMTTIRRFNMFTSSNRGYILTLYTDPEIQNNNVSQILSASIDGVKHELKSASLNHIDGQNEYTYELHTRKPDVLEKIAEEIRGMTGIKGVVLLAPETNLYI